jgi:hypothetical protein
VSRKGKGEADIEAADGAAYARFEIRKPRRGMSFVRANREIETVDVFPHREKEQNAGLGRWPLLQGYAYHWGAEVLFEPELDEVFGITNDKQTVRPVEDFWRVLAAEGVDKLVSRENDWQKKRRNERAEARKKARLDVDRAEPSPAERAAHAADVALGIKPEVPEDQKAAVREALEQRARAEAEATHRSKDEIFQALSKKARSWPYRVEYVERNDNVLYVPRFDGLQVVVSINKNHPFFSVLYCTLVDLPGGAQAKEAVDLVLIALAKGELADNEETAEVYRTQRESLWSPFLATAMRDLRRRYESGQVEEEVEGEGDEAA